MIKVYESFTQQRPSALFDYIPTKQCYFVGRSCINPVNVIKIIKCRQNRQVYTSLNLAFSTGKGGKPHRAAQLLPFPFAFPRLCP
jgi:hypothetical protein